MLDQIPLRVHLHAAHVWSRRRTGWLRKIGEKRPECVRGRASRCAGRAWSSRLRRMQDDSELSRRCVCHSDALFLGFWGRWSILAWEPKGSERAGAFRAISGRSKPWFLPVYSGCRKLPFSALIILVSRRGGIRGNSVQDGHIQPGRGPLTRDLLRTRRALTPPQDDRCETTAASFVHRVLVGKSAVLIRSMPTNGSPTINSSLENPSSATACRIRPL